jgi:hypothetical protein
MRNSSKSKGKDSILSFSIELLVYAVLVVAYFFLVIHYLGDWLFGLYQREHRLYALVALLLIIGQGLLLETITTALLRWIRSKLD